MASEQTVLNCIGRALWDPNPTTSDRQARQLAVALGYPRDWRVERSLDPDDGSLVDRIYTAKPGTGCDMWLNHADAMEAAAAWDDLPPELRTPFCFNGGHLLKPQPKFEKGDKVQVMYEGEWWDATILRRKEYPGNFKYQVYYPVDSSKQGGVEEHLIRFLPAEMDPDVKAAQLGLGEGWKAFAMGYNHWKIVSPDGETYKSKKAALEAYNAATAVAAVDEGDPPWRLAGHDFLGREVKWVTQYKVSARRTVELEQIGIVTGWISETDVDKDNQPGFVSDQTGKPAALFHVKFKEDKGHPYAAQLLTEQDLEAFEVLENLLPEVAEPVAKKARK